MTPSPTYRHLFTRLVDITTQPVRTWPVVHGEKSSTNDILTTYTLPLIGVMTLLAFVVEIWQAQQFVFEMALKKSTILFVSHFGVLFAAHHSIQWLDKQLNRHTEANNWLAVVAYPAGIIYLTVIVTLLFPKLAVVQFATIYAIYPIRTGMGTRFNNSRSWVIAGGLLIMLQALPLLIVRMAEPLFRL